MVFQRLADGIGAVAGAASLSQFPEFYQQYMQRLGGRLDQALVHRERILAAAREHALTAEEYVRRLLDNADPVAKSEGYNAAAALADAERLQTMHAALMHADPLRRPIVMAQYLDPDLAGATFDQFVPAVPLSLEALVYAAIGMVLGVMLIAAAERLTALPIALTRKARGRS